MAQDNIKNLYDALKSDYDLGSEDDFRNSLKDANNRRNLYKAIEGDYDLGSEQDFEKALGYGNRVNGTNEANKANTTTNTQQRNFTQEEYGRLSPTAQEVAQGVGVAPNHGTNGANETKGADKANVQERKPRVQFVPEASNVKGFTVAKDSPLRRQYPFLDQLGDDEQAFFKTDTNEPLYAWKDSEGKDITPDEAATLNQRADIEQNDAIRPHQVPVTSLYFERGANAGGVKTDKSVAGYVDSLIKQQYGNDYQDKQWTTEDGRTVSGAELLENMAQETYDQLNNDVKEARIALFEANGDKDAESKINTAMITKWQGVMSDKRMLETLHDENAMKQDVKDYAQGEIDKAREEERRIIEEMNKRGTELDAASSPYVDQTFNTRQVDNRYTFLTTELNAVRDRIRSWEAVRDSDDYGAMRALKDTAGNLRSWDLGYSDMIKGMHLVFGTEQDKKELANLLGNAERAKNFEQKAISDFARYVQIGGQSLPFMATFVGSGGGFRTLSKGVAKGAMKWAERKALQGIQKNAVKYLGVAAGDILAGYTLSGTLQGMGTLGDIMQRRAGDIEYNTEKGEYELVNPRGWAESAYKGATASMIDNATELLGDHLNIGKAAMKLLPKAGLKQVSDWLTKAGKSELYTTTREWLKRAGINSLGDEILEEEMAIPMNAVFVGDNPLLFGDGGLLDAKTQKDIVFGVGLSVFAMNAAAVSLHGTGQGINALQTMFDKDQRRLDAADNTAIEIIGGHKWTEIKNEIDNATNEELADVAQKIADDKELNEEQKKAAGEYVTSTLQMRGHNLGENAAMQSNEQRDAYLDSVLSPEERQNVHDDGMIHAAVLYPTAENNGQPQEVFITKGNIVMNADGTINAEASDKEIYYKGADGQAHITSPDKFQSVAQPINVEEYAAANAPQEAQAGYTPGQQVSVNIDGQDIQGEVTNVGEDGNVLVSFENPDGTLSSRWLAPEELEQSNGRIAEGQEEIHNGQPPITDEYSRFVDSGIVSDDTVALIADKIANGQQLTPEEESMRQGAVERVENLLKEKQNGQNRQTAQVEQASQPQQTEASVQEQTALSRIPVDEKGKPAYDKAEPDLAWDAIMEKTDGDEEMAKNVVDAMVKQQEAEVDKLKKKQPKAIPGDVDSMIAAQKEKKAAIAAAEERLEQWRKIADTPNRRAAATNVQPTQNPSDETSTQPATAIAPTENTGNVEPADTGNAQITEQGTEVPAGVQGTVEDGTVPERTSEDRQEGRSVPDRTEEVESVTEGLTSEDADNLLSAMEARAEVAPEIELTIENWDALFGEEGRVNTPLGEVKMGENQFTKLMRQGRNGKLGMIKPTLENPDIIIEDESKAKDGDNTERPSSYIFVKTFLKRDGSRYYYFASITVSKEGREVVVSSQEKSRNRILRLMLEGSVIWRTPKDAATSSAEKQGLDYAHPNEAEDATKGSGITPQSTSSESKDTQTSANEQTVGEKIAQEEAKVEQNPTEAQKEAGNYKKGHVKINGYDVTIENPKGSVRSGVDRNGQEWSVTMNNTYGYIRGTEGVDGDHIDVFLSDDPTHGDVYVIDQVNEDGSFDEHKVMYGFKSALAAKRAYLANYSPGWKGLGTITKVSKEEFKKWINNSHRKTKPFAEYKSVNKDGAQNEGNTLANEAHELFSDIIAQSTHNVEINDSGISETDNTLYAPIKVDGKDTSLSLYQEEPAHSSEKPIVGVSFYRDGMTYQEAADVSDEYNKYVGERVCADGSDELAINFGSIDEAVRFEEWLNDNGGVRFREAEDDSTHKQRQLEIINDTNPMLDDYHTGIRSEDDIKTMREAIEEARSEAEKYGDETWSAYPDITNEMLDEALRSGKITVYSSKPIVNGNFVTPSRMQASDYAGGGRIYSKTVNIDDVAWINTDEGQYANTDNDANGNIRFRFIGEQGAARLDATEEATTRLDNLATARLMEQAYNDKKARIDKLRDSKPVEITGEEIEPSDDLKQYKKNALEYGKKLQGNYVNKDTGITIQLQRGRRNGGINEVLQHDYKDVEHLQSVAAIPQIIENSIYIDSRENTDKEKNPNVAEYQYYVCGLKIGNTDYTVRSTIAVDNKGNRYYDHKLTSIEKGKLLDQINGQTAKNVGFGTTPGTKPTTDNGEVLNPEIQKSGNTSDYKDKRLISLLQTNDQENARKIKLATGWERGADGKWKYETPDFEYHPNGDARQNDKYKESDWYKELYDLEERLFNGETLTDEETKRFDELAARENEIRDNEKNTERIYLDDYVKDDELFNAYPELKQTRVDFVDLPNEEYSAKYNSEENRITVNQAKSMDVKSVLAHEIQHAIQRIEGFASGSNTDSYRNAATSENVIADINAATGGRLVESGGFNNTPEGIFDALNRKTTYGTILRDNSTELDEVARKYGYETIFDLVNDIGKFKSSVEMYRSEAGEVEARNVQERLNMTPEQRRNTLAEETEDVAREDQQFLQDAIGTGESLASTEQSNDIDTAVADTANKLNVGVRVAHSVDEVSDEGVRRAIEKGRNVKGWYDTRTGEIVVYAPNATDADDAVRTVLHEGVAHYGLRQLVGDENFDTFLDNIYNNVDGEIKAAIDEKVQRNGWSTRVATEEYLASLAEDTNFEAARSSGLWQRIKDFFMDLLTKAGIRLNEALTDNELRYILWRSYENLQEPNGRGTIGTVRDVAMQGRLGVGNYGNEDMRLREAEDEQTPEKKSENKYRKLYDKRVSRRRARLNRSYFDSMQPVKVLQKTITEETGQQIRPEENVYLQENRANSMAQRKHEMWERGHMEPARREVTKLMQQIMGGNWLTRRFKLPKTRRNAYNAVVRYMKSKHGLENNEYRRNMEAEAAREPFEAEIGAVEKLVKDGNISRAEADKRQAELKEQADKAETESRAKTLNKDYSGLQGIYGKDFERKAKEYVEDFEGAYDTAPLWREWNGATKAILEEEYKSGLLSKELYDRIRNMYKYYIPLKGWAENRAEDVYTYYATGSGDGGKPHRREGRTSESDDPLVTLEQDADRQFTAAARNRTKQALYNLATAHKSSLLTVRRQWYQNMGTKENPDWQRKDPEIPENATPEQMEQIIKDFEKDMRKLEKEGTAMRQKKPMILPYHATKSMEKEHTVRVMVNGKEYVIYVNGNPAAAQAVNGTSTPQDPDGSVLKRIYGALRWINRVKASLLTAVNVNFIPGNLVRDAQYSIQNMKAKEPVGYVLKYVKNLGEGMAKMTSARLFYKDKKGTLNMDDKTERLFKEFLDNGGETGYTARYTLEKQRRRNMAAINRMTGIDWLAGLRMLQHSLEYVNRSVETIVRFAAYKTSREAGRSIAQSINDAKEASVNFDKHGSGELGNKEWRLAYIFSNVGFQALRRLMENASGHPVRFTLAQIERFALGFAVPMMAKAMLDAYGDDDEKDAYEALPEWMRESGLAVPVSPILRKVGADDAADKVKRVFLYLPLGPEDKIWYALGENTWHLFNKDNITEEEAMDMAVKFGSLAADLLPLDFQGYGGNPIVSLAPTIVQDFVALEQNVNYWGQPIYRESTNYNEHDPGHRLAFTGTPEWYVERAEDINRLTGGDEYTKGWLSPKPEQIEYFINQTGGGVTRVVNQVMSLIERAGEDGNKDIQVLKNVPVVSSLVKKADVQDGKDGFDREKYYDYIDEYEKALHDYNAYRKAKRNGDDEAGQKAEKLKESPTGERMDIIRKDIRKIRNKDKQVRRIDEKENPTAKEEARRDKLKTESNELKQKLLEKLDKVKEKPGKQ